GGRPGQGLGRAESHQGGNRHEGAGAGDRRAEGAGSQFGLGRSRGAHGGGNGPQHGDRNHRLTPRGPGAERIGRCATVSREKGRTRMVRMGKDEAEQLLKGKSPREIYEIVRERVSAAPDASINDFFETLDWVVKEGYATEAELEAVEEEN